MKKPQPAAGGSRKFFETTLDDVASEADDTEYITNDSYDTDNTTEANLVLMAAHTNNSPFNEDLVVLDCASGINLCKSRKHARNIQGCQPGTVSGITGICCT